MGSTYSVYVYIYIFIFNIPIVNLYINIIVFIYIYDIIAYNLHDNHPSLPCPAAGRSSAHRSWPKAPHPGVAPAEPGAGPGDFSG